MTDAKDEVKAEDDELTDAAEEAADAINEESDEKLARDEKVAKDEVRDQA